MAELKRLIVITASFEGAGVALQAQAEGLDVILAVIPKWSETLTKEELEADDGKENPEDLAIRMKNYEGILPKIPATKLAALIKKLSDQEKQETFIYCDMNYTFKYAQELVGLGVPGNYPTEEDRHLEANRDDGKDFVKKYYADTEVKVADVHEFNKVEDAMQFLEEEMQEGEDDDRKLWVLKGNNSSAETIVPLSTDTPEQAFELMKTALDKDPKSYESEGFILEQFIPNAMEITPQAYFWNGELLATSIDIEIKKKGSGLSGRTVGCAANLIVPTKLEDRINKIAFPPKVYEMAKEHTGLFLWDASLLIDPKTDDVYFGEFCANRFGYDQTQVDMTLCGGVKYFFENIMNGRSPYTNQMGKFGFGVRLFNELDDEKIPGKAASDVPFFVDEEVAEYVFPMYVYKDEEGYKTSGYDRDLTVVTCAMDTIEAAAEGCYKYMEKISFKDYSRLSLDDVLSTRYDGAILNRFNYGSGKLYDIINRETESNVTNDNKLSTDNLQSDTIEKTTEPQPVVTSIISSMRGVLDTLNAVMNQNEELKKKFSDRMQKTEQEFQRQMIEYRESLRTEMAVKFSAPSDQTKQNKQVETLALQVGSMVQEFKAAVGAIGNVAGLEEKLKDIERGLKPLENNSYLVKISDRLATLEVTMLEVAKLLKRPQVDNVGPQLMRVFGELQKQLTENTDRQIKSSKETITVVGGGAKPSVNGLINVSYDYVALSNYSGTNPQRIICKSGGANGNTVADLILTYDGSGNLLTVTKARPN